MECRDVRTLSDAYLSGELLVETTHRLAQHVQYCPACRAEIEVRRGLRDALRSAFDGAPDLQARPEFLTGLKRRLQPDVPQRKPAWRSWLARAAGVVVIVGLGAGSLLWLGGVALTELAHLAAGDHQNCALKYALQERPISLAEAARFDPAFGRLEAVLFDGRAAGGEPIEYIERHACVYRGQRFAHVVVRYKGAAVSLLVADERASRDEWFRPASTGVEAVAGDARFNTVSFRSADRRVFVVSTLPSQDVSDVAQAMRIPLAAALDGR